MAQEDLQQSIDDLNQRMDDNDNTLQDFSDNQDTALTDVQSTLDEHSASIDTLNENSGQLTFPLNQDTIDLIKEQFPSGSGSLVTGNLTITDTRISPDSVVLLSVSKANGTQGILSYAASAGSMVVSSTSGTETSKVVYLILN